MDENRIVPINRELKEFMQPEFDRLDRKLDRLLAMLERSRDGEKDAGEIPFDTRAAYRRLQAGGFTPQQADTIVCLLRDVMMGGPIRSPHEDITR